MKHLANHTFPDHFRGSTMVSTSVHVRLALLSAFVAALLMTTTPAVAQDLLTTRELSVATATEAAVAALADCTAKGYRVAVAVTDRGGQVRVMLRGDSAGPHHLDSARRKAYTAASSGSSTLVWSENLAKGLRAPDPNLVHLEGVLIIGGGLPIKVGEQVVGAIGVGGAPGGDRDDVCARAGITKIQDELR